MRWSVLLLLATGCEAVSGLDSLEFVPEVCTGEPAPELCASLACGETVDRCGATVMCPDLCAPPYACEVGGVPANTCGCSGPPNLTPPPPAECTQVPVASGHAHYFCGSGTFDEARAFCRSFGTDLVIVGDAVENGSVWQQMPLKSFIGLYDPTECIGLGCPFEWVDGSAPSYTNWAPLEPNNTDNIEHCVELIKDDIDPQKVARWNDVPCSSTRGIVCETTCPPL
jgi:hypothetical protein